MTSNKKLLTGSVLALGAVLAIFLINSNNKNDQTEPVASLDKQIKTEDAATISVTPPESNAAQEVVTAPTPLSRNDDTSDVIPATPWISAPLNELSNELYDFIEAEQVSYISTTDYPFDEQKQKQLRTLARQGVPILFDNTESSYLDSYGVSETKVVSEYFGTASEGDVIIATGVQNADGSIHYLVLPLKSKDLNDNSKLIEDTKLAITLLKEQKHDLIKERQNEHRE
ncbi:topoisomerase I [Vibrio alginolyticus]|uniref:topoisomerase I n=1 Tax=Vibrio alginolyticus TaxID=663 RepID=UPI00215C1851|nr:topoisomerase I [Vibrio alginolyticus]EGR2557212.1 topoisomerase I [Vibrio alginolyticus]EJV5741290.1 topoisomerase I [Vibrio alginolyticus]EKD1483145.1 topoisomerase I [Vibrio alginolyticus]MCR9452096.1 topoisomerase I [Vibrio alginolyticus]MCR9464155.1 topoisomerase I [Vibrio alginolyticus]